MEIPLTNWIYMGPRFVAKGYCVFALTYRQNPKFPLLADKVDMLGHSQGSVMPRYRMKYLGGAAKIRKSAGIGSVQYGSTLVGIVPLAKALGLFGPIKKIIDPLCEACYQFALNSTILNDLNEGGTLFLELAIFLLPLNNNPRVHNQVLQDWCGIDIQGHVSVAYDPITWNGLHAYFTPSADQKINCLDAFQ
ncbi:hypothetical protein BGZ96_012788 [Linnemannia gamsii]|uniref:Uncharacterized protein n=1 Tax=Linnemannia gamsii TaxID=64522 RepID=A0ABQ7JQ06_9FUNG|nr:hypothetical protein BGZ96_012788 [Linnemannia gamsii]